MKLPFGTRCTWSMSIALDNVSDPFFFHATPDVVAEGAESDKESHQSRKS